MSDESSRREMEGERASATSGGAQNVPRGAMTRAMNAFGSSDARVLRIGVIEDGRILEERTIGERESVRVGTAEKNDFVVKAPGFPARFELFQAVGEAYVMNFTDAMQGRVASQLGASKLDELRNDGSARNAGTHWQIKLRDNARGKITIGTTTFLFQLVPKKRVSPRPQLPSAVRGGFRRRRSTVRCRGRGRICGAGR